MMILVVVATPLRPNPCCETPDRDRACDEQGYPVAEDGVLAVVATGRWGVERSALAIAVHGC